MNERPTPKRGPIWGFHEPTVTAAQGVGPAIQGMGRAMQDPRFGMAGGLGAVTGLGKLRGRLFQPTRESGGFSVPTGKLLRDEPALGAYMDAHKPGPTQADEQVYRRLGFDQERANEIFNTRLPGPREGYIEQIENTNSIAKDLMSPIPSVRRESAQNVHDADLNREGYLSRIVKGLQALKKAPSRN